MSDKTVRVLKQIDAALKCIERDYANPFNADVLLAAKARIEELERAVLAASEDRGDAAIGRYVLQHAVMVDQSVEGLTRLMLADDCTNGALSDTIIAAIAAAGNHKVEG